MTARICGHDMIFARLAELAVRPVPARRTTASNSSAVRTSVRRVAKRAVAAQKTPAIRSVAARRRDFSHLAGLEAAHASAVAARAEAEVTLAGAQTQLAELQRADRHLKLLENNWIGHV